MEERYILTRSFLVRRCLLPHQAGDGVVIHYKVGVIDWIRTQTGGAFAQICDQASYTQYELSILLSSAGYH